MTLRERFGRVGIWVSRRLDAGERRSIALAAAPQGYGALWLGGGIKAGVFPDLRSLLEVSGRLPVGTSVLNIWMESAGDCAAGFAELEAVHPGRVHLGLGISHAPAVEGAGLGTYDRPLGRMRGYLDELEAQDKRVPRDRLLIGALGPRMLELAAARTAGAVPYLAPVEHTRWARDALGPDAVLAPELTVAVHADLEQARTAARRHLATYLALPNYTNSFARFGFGPNHLERGGSDALLDAIYGLGSTGRVADRIRAHLEAGADHVALQVARVPGGSTAETYAQLAPAALDII